ncbi:FAD-binding oxidoreductase [Granulicoccus phenolivorans]|uniref:FAD-binding oxidoreductase n=1 Tax=Granulicoccus phenolivorans TaxID=266854 RepID=UPI001FE1D8D2|nr:FAD-binding oxidoreductase [Granulicoccus phenolivorans]
MNGVKHMKWWGWGVEGIAFNHENKPAFAPFVQKVVGIDLHETPQMKPPAFEEIEVPASLLSEESVTKLRRLVGDSYVVLDDQDRVVHAYGKSVRDLIRLRRGDLPRVPDAVLYPADESQVIAIMNFALSEDAVLIPFGGGSNIVGSLTPEKGETRPILSIDMGRMNKVLDLDAESGLARIQAGVLGPHLEEQLNRRGWTMGHFPDSFTHSTLGGWVATRSSGMQSDKYGDIGEITRGLRMVTPSRAGDSAEVLALRPLPATSTGPSVREMVLGSEGRLGIITEVTVNVRQQAEERTVIAYFFPTWSAGLKCMHDIAKSEAEVLVARVSDARETAFSLATQKKKSRASKFVNDAFFKVLQRKGWNLDDLCISYIGYEGSKKHVALQKDLVKDIVTRHGGVVVGTGPGAMYDQKKFDTPYIRDFLLDRGAAADVSETAAPYSRLQALYDNTVEAAEQAMERLGVQGYIMCHLSHNYHSGACLYFTFAIRDMSEDVLDKYDEVKRAIQQAFIDSHGTLSHHHGVGVEHSPWLVEDISQAGADMIRTLFEGVDPGNNLNPGKVVHDGLPGVSVVSSDHVAQPITHRRVVEGRSAQTPKPAEKAAGNGSAPVAQDAEAPAPQA